MPSLAEFVIVRFDELTGSKCSTDPRCHGCVHVPSVETNLSDKKEDRFGQEFRAQLTLVLRRAITTSHLLSKPQGQSIVQAASDHGKIEVISGPCLRVSEPCRAYHKPLL